jgi:hypothetical protein
MRLAVFQDRGRFDDEAIPARAYPHRDKVFAELVGNNGRNPCRAGVQVYG